MNPMLKYRGGKSKEIPFFEHLIPKKFNTYIEPFLGGGALFFHLEPNNAIVGDINEKLVTFYMNVRDNYDELRAQLDILHRVYAENQTLYKTQKARSNGERVENKNEALYYLIRDMYNGKIPSGYLEGVLYFFINKTAYSGMIRYNSNGEYNVPFGRYPNFNTQLVTIEHSILLKKAQLFRTDYANIFAMARSDDFMFLDPPYDCVFNDYGNIDMMNGFNEAEHIRLANDFRNLSCKAMMVIGKTPLTLDLYHRYIKAEYDKSYAVNIRNRFKSEAKHIVVMNYEN